MKLTRKHAEQIAKDFLTTMNPTNWNGCENPPKEFDKRIKTYDFRSPFVVLDISFEYDNNEGWYHLCEIVDKGTNEMYEMLSGYGVDSYLNLTDTILDICNTYDWFI